MSEHFHLEEISIQNIKLFEDSFEHFIFKDIDYLKSCKINFLFHKILEGQEIKAISILPISENKKEIIDNDLIIYSGIFFKIDKERPFVKKREEEFQIFQFYIKYMTENFDKIKLNLHHNIRDVRPFLWFNYNTSEPKFKVKINYTSILDITELVEIQNSQESLIFKNLEPVRRYSIRQAAKDNYKIKFHYNNKIFFENFKKFYLSYSGEEGMLSSIENIIRELIKNKKGFITSVYDKNENDIYHIYIAYDNKMAYYLYGCSTGNSEKPWQATIGLWESILYCSKKLKLKKFNFEGINSPKRGWFKLGFGGSITPYYTVSYDRKS